MLQKSLNMFYCLLKNDCFMFFCRYIVINLKSGIIFFSRTAPMAVTAAFCWNGRIIQALRPKNCDTKIMSKRIKSSQQSANSSYYTNSESKQKYWTKQTIHFKS